MSSNSPALNLVMPHFSEMWIFWWSEDMNLALCWLNHMFLTLQHGMDGHDDLTTVPRIPEGTTHTCLKPVSPSKGHHVGSDGMERVEPHSNMKGFFQQLFTMYMTQIQVVSRTHLHLTPIRPQSRNSSTSDFSCTLPNHENASAEVIWYMACSYNISNTLEQKREWFIFNTHNYIIFSNKKKVKEKQKKVNKHTVLT